MNNRNSEVIYLNIFIGRKVKGDKSRLKVLSKELFESPIFGNKKSIMNLFHKWIHMIHLL